MTALGPAASRGPEISLGTTVAATPQQVSTSVGAETIILHLDSGTYFGLEGVGARIWELLAEPVRVEVVRDALLAEYEVETERCEPDLLALLDELAVRGLIEVDAADG